MKQDLRVAVTKRMIKDALLGLLETKPLDKIKISELCVVSGVNRATFYRHYETLQGVLREIEWEFVQQMPRLTTPLHSARDTLAYIESFCTYFYSHADIVKLLFLNRSDADILQVLNDFSQHFLELHKANLPAMDEDTVKAIVTLFSGGGHFLLRQWILGDIRKTPQEIAAILCSVFRLPNGKDFS